MKGRLQSKASVRAERRTHPVECDAALFDPRGVVRVHRWQVPNAPNPMSRFLC